MVVSTAAQRPLAVLPCQGQRSLPTNLRVQPHALRISQATARQQRQGGHRVVCSAVADKPVVSNGAPASDFKAWESVITSVKQRDDIKTIMLFGAGPIVIGQACEFDYSGTQACKALRAEGYKIILINSNPATIMTDPETADKTYIGPMTPDVVAEIIEKERPDAVLPTMGGQTALNLAKALSENGTLDKYNVELLGAKLPSINRAEDRNLFKQAMTKIGLKTPQSGIANTMEEALQVHQDIGRFPLIIRPAFTLGGTGGGIAYNMEEYQDIVQQGISASMTNQVLIEMSLLGWKEFELEVMRDMADNVVIICSIENVDPMGVHTGDSITIAPAQTLTDKEYQRLRDAAVAIIREMGVECGGSNVQMGINPEDGEMMIIEMNPRVSRSSALASKATGFPIAKIAAKLAMGKTMDMIPNDITSKTPASFEPSIDYVVTKIPRFAFEKFPGAKAELSTQMKSVGEAMAIGRTFQESFQKALRSLETGCDGWSLPRKWKRLDPSMVVYRLRVPNPERVLVIKQGFEDGLTQADIREYTQMDPWFIEQLWELHQAETWLKTQQLTDISADDMLHTKQRGFSDVQIARFTSSTPLEVRARRKELGVIPSMKRVDTCAAEFEAATPYMYSSYDGNCECEPTSERKVLILGAGPNRIGQGIEFDYCCCHASFALRDAGFETIMLNCNPETVSTDYDTSSRLYFEPLTVEDVLNVIEKERPEGIIVQFGGQTPLSIAKPLQEALEKNPIPAASGIGNTQIWGTQPDSIDEAEDRDRWMACLQRLDIKQPPGGMVTTEEGALSEAGKLGYPVMVRPSYVLGGRAMEIVYSDKDLQRYINTAVEVDSERPVLVDKYLDRADELDVDALCDKDGNVVITGIMQHIEQAGVHSGDSACVIPTQGISPEALATIREWTPKLAKDLRVIGLINIQYCVQDNQVYIIEANPRASRTVPFVAKAVGHPIVKYASLLMAGKSLAEIGFTEEPKLNHVAVKEAVLPFDKFPGADTLLGPEMRSTGEVMGIDRDFSSAYAKAAMAAGQQLPTGGNVFITMTDKCKPDIVPVAKQLSELGFGIYATEGTQMALEKGGVKCERVLKIQEGRPNAGDMLKNGEISMLLLTTTGDEPDVRDGKDLRRLALALKVPIITTVAGAVATANALKGLRNKPLQHIPLQDYFPDYIDAQAALSKEVEAPKAPPPLAPAS
jgi:carbamoyl-phosphate synthase large subunit